MIRLLLLSAVTLCCGCKDSQPYYRVGYYITDDYVYQQLRFPADKLDAVKADQKLGRAGKITGPYFQ
jgi:hypothetical protein